MCEFLSEFVFFFSSLFLFTLIFRSCDAVFISNKWISCCYHVSKLPIHTKTISILLVVHHRVKCIHFFFLQPYAEKSLNFIKAINQLHDVHQHIFFCYTYIYLHICTHENNNNNKQHKRTKHNFSISIVGSWWWCFTNLMKNQYPIHERERN